VIIILATDSLDTFDSSMRLFGDSSAKASRGRAGERRKTKDPINPLTQKMSQVYSTEPSPTGRVIFTTTHGPIDINLFCKECPTTSRSFLQLCLDGFYDGMIFHRILPDFLVQTGLTKGSDGGGGGGGGGTDPKLMDAYLRKSSAVVSSPTGDVLGWERKGLELNPRIRFNHRGQVAAAFPLKDSAHTDDETMNLRYQFFITLDESPFLDGNHVIFGTIAGPTIFNALRIGKTDADEATGTPVDMVDSPPRIQSVKVDYHPFQDLVVTAEKLIPWRIEEKSKSGKGQSEVEKRRKKRKGKRDLNVLSFGDEERDYEEIVKDKAAILSSHDVLHEESEFLSGSVDAELKKKMEEKGTATTDQRKSENGASRRKKIMFDDEEVNTVSEQTLQEDQSSKNVTDAVENARHESIMKQTDRAAAAAKQLTAHRDDQESKPKKSKSIGAIEARRAKYLKSGHSLASKKERLKREDDTMAKLMVFRNKVLETKSSSKSANENGVKQADDSLASRMAKRVEDAGHKEAAAFKEKEKMISAPGYHGQVDDESVHSDNTENDWLGTKFKCKRHVDHDARMLDKTDEGGDGRHMDDYLVMDDKKKRKGSHHHGKHRHSGHKDHHQRRDELYHKK
jgi:peptidyl-prolyl cis-trans isomerase SDCCAG10